MKRVVLLYFLFAGSFLPMRAQDSLPVKYFDGNLVVSDISGAYFYGFVQPVSKRQNSAVLYNSDQQKIALVNYSKDLEYREGLVIGFFPSGDTQFVCHYSKDKLNGLWQSWFINGKRCDSGRLKNNAPDGLWKSWYPTGQLRSEADFNAKRLSDIKDDMTRAYRPSFLVGQNNGIRGSFSNNAAFLYQQSLYNEMRLATHPPEIIGRLTNLSLKIKADYNTTMLAHDTRKYEPPFSECVIHGLYKSYFADGSLKDSGYCFNGSRIGVWQEWDEKSDLRAIGFYKKGVRRDQWMYYNKEGKLVFVQRYTRWGKMKDKIFMN